MGTYQQLTTEQLEVLILIDMINKFLEKNIDASVDSMVETVKDNIETEDSISSIFIMLEHYGYIEEDADMEYDITLDGKQYVKLFNEYLKAKDENLEMVHNRFSLINIEKIQFSLVDSFKLFGMDFEMKGILDSISSILKKIKKA